MHCELQPLSLSLMSTEARTYGFEVSGKQMLVMLNEQHIRSLGAVDLFQKLLLSSDRVMAQVEVVCLSRWLFVLVWLRRPACTIWWRPDEVDVVVAKPALLYRVSKKCHCRKRNGSRIPISLSAWWWICFAVKSWDLESSQKCGGWQEEAALSLVSGEIHMASEKMTYRGARNVFTNCV